MKTGYARYPLAAIVLTLLIGCAEDRFVANDPQIVVTAYEAEANPYVEVDNDNRTINLGEVPVYGMKKAVFRVDNPTTQNLVIQALTYTETLSTTWGDPTWLKNKNDTVSKLPPLTVPGGGYRLIEIPFAPLEEGEAKAIVTVESNASNGRMTELTVLATGVYHGESIIEIEYSGLLGPTEADCVGGICDIAADRALEFGNIGLNMDATSKLIIRNKAQCDPYPGGDPCNPCNLLVASTTDPAKGITFEDEAIACEEGAESCGCTDDDGNAISCFELVGSNVPFEVRQSDVDCGNTGEQKVMLSFKAPGAEGTHSITVVIDSNDPNKPQIRLPITARARNAPIAIGKLRECQTLDANGNLITSDCVYEDEIEPLNRVYFDGSESYDPSGGTIATYRWEVVEAPQGVNPDDYAWAGQNSAVSSFWIPIAGHYVVRLTVWNDSGIESGDTAEARVEFDAVPQSMLHVQLVWDHSSNDQDLHMTYASVNPNLCSSNHDCFFSNKQPTWFPTSAAGEGPNPRLDKDDTNGLGPENINIDEPGAGVYRVYVHYYPWSSAGAPTMETVRIYLSGVLRFAEQRTLTQEEQVWAVADVTWVDDGSEFGYGEVTPYPSTDPNQVGAVAYRDSSACYTETGWPFPN